MIALAPALFGAGSARAAESDSATRSAARRLGTSGVEAFEAGDYKTASDRLERSYAKAPATHYAAGAGVVTDNYTHLMWEMPKPAEKQTLADAELRCEMLSLGGASDWRLPSMNELQTLVDVTAINPALDTNVFTDESGENAAMDWTMSTTSFGNYWVMQWEGGVTPSVGEQSDHRSRCVRVIP